MFKRNLSRIVGMVSDLAGELHRGLLALRGVHLAIRADALRELRQHLVDAHFRFLERLVVVFQALVF